MAATAREQRYERDANFVPDFLDDHIDLERDCDYSTSMRTDLAAGAMCLGLVDNYLHLGTRRGMMDLLEELYNYRMVLMFCAREELTREIHAVLGNLEGSACAISLWTRSLWRSSRPTS